MRHFILSLVLLTICGFSFSQSTVSGYYVTNDNDSIDAQIKMPKSIFGSVDLSKFLFKVEVNDGSNSPKKLKPEDIKGFGFMFNGETYSFFSKPTMTEKNLKFLQPVILGPKTNLYQFQTIDQNGKPLGTFYTFQKADGTYTFLNTGIPGLSEFRKTLKEFYKDEIHLQQLIDTKFESRKSIKNDIMEIVQTSNK
jgi:hypothetical protein